MTNRLPCTDLHTGSPGGFLTDASSPFGDREAPVPTCGSSIARSKGSSLDTPGALCESLCTHLSAVLRTRVVEIVADFTRDSLGNWWLLQIKRFRAVAYGPAPRQQTVSEMAAHVTCRCCGRYYTPLQLRQKLTPRMIWRMVAHQKARGVSFSWHLHAESCGAAGVGGEQEASGEDGGPKTTIARLAMPTRMNEGVKDAYGGVRVCDLCNDMYHAEERLRKAAFKLSWQLGMAPSSITVRSPAGAGAGGGVDAPSGHVAQPASAVVQEPPAWREKAAAEAAQLVVEAAAAGGDDHFEPSGVHRGGNQMMGQQIASRQSLHQSVSGAGRSGRMLGGPRHSYIRHSAGVESAGNGSDHGSEVAAAAAAASDIGLAASLAPLHSAAERRRLHLGGWRLLLCLKELRGAQDTMVAMGLIGQAAAPGGNESDARRRRRRAASSAGRVLIFSLLGVEVAIPLPARHSKAEKGAHIA